MQPQTALRPSIQPAKALRPSIPFPLSAGQAPRRPYTAPFTYATDLDAIRALMADNDVILARERTLLAWAIKHRRTDAARQARAAIDRMERDGTAGRARLFELEQRAADAVMVEAAIAVELALAPAFGERRYAMAAE